MGIDVYLRWPDQTSAEHDEQITGFSIGHGDVGYLREAYHGGPYATQVLLDDNRYWEPKDEDLAEWTDDWCVELDVPRLRAQLEPAIEAARERERLVYNATDEEVAKSMMVESLRAFVELAEAKERQVGRVGVTISW